MHRACLAWAGDRYQETKGDYRKEVYYGDIQGFQEEHIGVQKDQGEQGMLTGNVNMKWREDMLHVIMCKEGDMKY